MFRLVTAADVDRVADLAIESTLFPEEARGFLLDQMNGWLRSSDPSGAWIVDDSDGAIRSVAFYEPRAATDRVWYLTMIAVAPSAQGSGLGSATLSHVEQVLRASGQRLLLIETSSTPQYERTRAFYAKHGYTREAVVRDYFTDGDDMVLFRKDLRVP
ncbi:MAG: GNAT family N-acetyltransferase [Myxococcales bacterium]|nr:GNAT family N-acetyltransferase [Myxococcales bacterium]